MIPKHIPTQTLQRLPVYLSYLKSLPDRETAYISAPSIAAAMGLNEVVVRKDLAMVSTSGRPKVGYAAEDLLSDIQKFLGYDNVNSAVLVGAGNLGRALLSYKGFAEYGMNIVAAFDNSPEAAGASGKPILPPDELETFCRENNIRIGIITVPAESAQKICDRLVSAGIIAIWNFAPVHLSVPSDILVKNEDMAYSLAILSNHIFEKYGR